MAEHLSSLYASSTLLVAGKDLHLPRVLLTFTHWNKRKPVNAGLATAAGMGFIGVAARQNHWWQVSDFPEAMKRVRSALAANAEVTTFGSSMGGAGALLAAQFVPVFTVLSVAPPIIVDPEVAPWERRFRSVGHLTKCIFPLGPNASEATETYLVYDPFYQADVDHLQLLQQAGREFQRWPLPHSNHTPLLELSKAGLYRDFTTAFFVDRNPGEAYDILRASRHRRGVPQWKWALRRMFKGGRYKNPDYIEFLSWMIRHYGDQIEFLEERGLAYSRSGLHDLALRDFERCAEIENRGRYTLKVEAARAMLEQA
ncbi:hypothetical protein [Paracoccus sp. ME4]|uniref:hypothetical protein n=1 Tax=Paracoccus sp. ME4 TaxID=3138066 RepID=UPI00398B2F4D